jgi:ferredoxin
MLTQNPSVITPNNLAKKLIREAKRATNFVEKIKQNQPYIKGKGLGSIMGFLQRPYYKKEIKRFQKNIKIVEERCNQCKLCISICPVGNFEIQEDKIVPLQKCNLCFRCMSHCPQKAIYITKKPYLPNASLYIGPTPDFKPIKLRKEFS